MPLTFLGGPFYSISMLPPIWQKLSLLNPSVYLISGFRWSFFDKSEMPHRHQLRDDLRLLRHLARDRDVDHAHRLAAEGVRTPR